MSVLFQLRHRADGRLNFGALSGGADADDRHLIRLPAPHPLSPYRLCVAFSQPDRTLGTPLFVTNYPVTPDESLSDTCPPFQRDVFHARSMAYDRHADVYTVHFTVQRPGAFEYAILFPDQRQQPFEYGERQAVAQQSYATATASVKSRRLDRVEMERSFKLGGQRFFFLVDPLLSIRPRFSAAGSGDSDHAAPLTLHLDSICLLTVVPKWLGPMANWNKHWPAISQAGYNMVHFVPMQSRGASNSPYSIFDQLALSPDLFPDSLRGAVVQQFRALETELSTLETQHGILSVTDIVWNHTAHNSAWLEHHPDAGYNLVNSPHLCIAYDLDEAIMQFSASLETCQPVTDDTGQKRPFNTLTSDKDLKRIIDKFLSEQLPALRLWEYYVVGVDSHVQAVVSACQQIKDNARDYPVEKEIVYCEAWRELAVGEQAARLYKRALYTDGQNGTRNNKHLLLDTCLAAVFALLSPLFRQDRTQIDCGQVADIMRKLINEINVDAYKQYDADMSLMVQNVTQRVRYERLDDHGPKMGPVTSDVPLVSTYFTRIPHEREPGDDGKKFIVANNGWIWNADPLVDFAGPKSKSYLVREIIPWGDCVKLRYGSCEADNPWLWSHMKAYTAQMARYFHGFRIDNCHSTPIHVAQAFLDHARQIRPNLYVIAELFTGSEERDVVFVRALGINSLIREAMSAWNPDEMSRLVWKYGGQPCGSMSLQAQYLPCNTVGHKLADIDASIVGVLNLPQAEELKRFDHCQCISPTERETIVLSVRPSAPHALFMDCTHDNETPAQKRNACDTLSNAALVCMTSCAIGSVYGYDWLVPKHLNIVNEKRLYSIPGYSQGRGIIPAKVILQMTHYLLGQKGYSEVHVHRDNKFICVSRQNPFTHHGFMLIAHTAFDKQNYSDSATIAPIDLRNIVIRPIMAARLVDVREPRLPNSAQDITGLDSHLQLFAGSLPADMIKVSQVEDSLGQLLTLKINAETGAFPPGSVLLLETELLPPARKSIETLKKQLQLSHHGSWYVDCIVRHAIPGLQVAVFPLGAVEINIALFRVDSEEKEAIVDGGAYSVPGTAQLLYCGIQGWVKMVAEVVASNDLGHPLCAHLRLGHWAMDYCYVRLEKYAVRYPALSLLATWLKETFRLVKMLPSFLAPKFFCLIILTVHRALLDHSWRRMPPFISSPTCDPLVAACALGFHQMYALVPSASLQVDGGQERASLAAGLPHFSTRHMRCWGRDVFISMRGLVLLTGQWQVARDHLLAFAAVVRHGLIPNLLDGGRIPRYNARDATWFFLQSVQDYCSQAPDGLSLLAETVTRRYTDDHDDSHYLHPHTPATVSTVAEIVQEIMQKHYSGIHFREFRAGADLDHAMKSDGFNIDVVMDRKTGFLMGGNQFNCGTWMDKMGDSAEAGTVGVPATPRDGAPVEIVGLLKSTVKWLSKLHSQAKFAWAGVQDEDATVFTYADWDRLIMEQFEKNFYIPLDGVDDKGYTIKSELINRRGIYKDCFGSSQPYTDYQFRPNFCVAMVVAPELFAAPRAKSALQLCRKVLRGPLGMKTLDPTDWAYRGDYNNGDRSSDAKISHGFNYHQGPEWVWLSGYFYRAYLKFVDDSAGQVHDWLRTHRQMIVHDSAYAGLPELTNADGKVCADSCPTQAWSMGTILEACWDLEQRQARGA